MLCALLEASPQYMFCISEGTGGSAAFKKKNMQSNI